jgi:hypothetical protein
MGKPICALARMPCPQTNDNNAKVYCPHWKVGIPEHEKDGSGRIRPLDLYTGCQVPKLLVYIQSLTVEVDHAHKASNQARDAALELTGEFKSQENRLRAAVLPALLGGLQRQDQKDGEGLMLSEMIG